MGHQIDSMEEKLSCFFLFTKETGLMETLGKTFHAGAANSLKSFSDINTINNKCIHQDGTFCTINVFRKITFLN